MGGGWGEAVDDRPPQPPRQRRSARARAHHRLQAHGALFLLPLRQRADLRQHERVAGGRAGILQHHGGHRGGVVGDGGPVAAAAAAAATRHRRLVLVSRCGAHHARHHGLHSAGAGGSRATPRLERALDVQRHEPLQEGVFLVVRCDAARLCQLSRHAAVCVTVHLRHGHALGGWHYDAGVPWVHDERRGLRVGLVHLHGGHDQVGVQARLPEAHEQHQDGGVVGRDGARRGDAVEAELGPRKHAVVERPLLLRQLHVDHLHGGGGRGGGGLAGRHAGT
jgi:hypothetical protein